MAVALLLRASSRSCHGCWSILSMEKSALRSQVHLCLLAATKERPFAQSSLVPSTRLYSSNAADSGSGSSEKLTFEEYRKLRKSLKLRGRVAGLPMAFIGMAISSFICVHYNPNMFSMTPEEVQPIYGVDPIVFSSLCGVASGLVGYIVGGALFHVTWRTLYKRKAKALQERENDFLERVQRYRFSQVSRYDDDYYADKVVTLSDYRQWVRQQQKRQELSETAAKTTNTDTDQSTTQV